MTPQQIVARLRAEGHAVFTGALNVNIVVERRRREAPDQWDRFIDVLHLIEVDPLTGTATSVVSAPCTSLSGPPGLTAPRNPAGTAILDLGQQRGVWQLGRHQNRYAALVQRAPIRVRRWTGRALPPADFDETTLPAATGWFGINLHGSANDPTTQADNPTPLGRRAVGRWSEGCVVLAVNTHYRAVIEYLRRAAARFGNSFSVTVLRA